MSFKRKIELEMQKWKDSLSFKKKALLIKGLRQIGKTTSISEFAKKNFPNVITINFKTEKRLKKAFEGDLDVETLIRNISAMRPDVHFIPYKTVLFFDEIQECSGARSSIKNFMLDGRYDIIASGSLLGIKGYNRSYNGGVPVGFEHTVYMKPMDFEEFLWAKGLSENVLTYLKDCFDKREKIDEPIHEQMLRYFKEYICVGGMPSAVDVYIRSGDFNAVRDEQRDILESYRDDFGKHLDKNENEEIDSALLARINKVVDSLPSQLAKENKKFMYSNIEKKATSMTYEPAIQWLVDYGLVGRCYNLHLLEKPLLGNKRDDIFKLYVMDTGLFIAMLDETASGEILLYDMGIYKGAVYENIIADAFSKNGKSLYYYSKSSGLEIDFVTEYDRKIRLIEVKSSNGNTKSSKMILNDKIHYPQVEGLIKLCSRNISEDNGILTIPHYLAYLIK